MRRLGFTFWLRRNVSRLALMLGIFCIVEIFMHLTEGTNPNTRMPLGYWPYFVAGLGLLSFGIAWWTYIPPAPRHADTPHRADAPGERKE